MSLGTYPRSSSFRRRTRIAYLSNGLVGSRIRQMSSPRTQQLTTGLPVSVHDPVYVKVEVLLLVSAPSPGLRIGRVVCSSRQIKFAVSRAERPMQIKIGRTAALLTVELSRLERGVIFSHRRRDLRFVTSPKGKRHSAQATIASRLNAVTARTKEEKIGGWPTQVF